MTMWLITVKPSYDSGSRIVAGQVRPCYNSLEDRSPLQGNTVGSQPKTHLAYIAGFLDGDGSLMLQVKKRNDTKRGTRFMVTMCLYQDTRHEQPLYWIRDVFGIGYVSKRKDGISELRINGYARVHALLVHLAPYIRFKVKQTEALLEACSILRSGTIKTLSKRQIRRLIDLLIVVQNENYVTKRKKQKDELYELFGLTP